MSIGCPPHIRPRKRGSVVIGSLSGILKMSVVSEREVLQPRTPVHFPACKGVLNSCEQANVSWRQKALSRQHDSNHGVLEIRVVANRRLKQKPIHFNLRAFMLQRWSSAQCHKGCATVSAVHGNESGASGLYPTENSTREQHQRTGQENRTRDQKTETAQQQVVNPSFRQRNGSGLIAATSEYVPPQKWYTIMMAFPG